MTAAWRQVTICPGFCPHCDEKGHAGAEAALRGIAARDSVRTLDLSNWPAAAHYSVKARIALQIYNRGTVPTMLAKLKSGRSIDEVIAWAADELEGCTR